MPRRILRLYLQKVCKKNFRAELRDIKDDLKWCEHSLWSWAGMLNMVTVSPLICKFTAFLVTVLASTFFVFLNWCLNFYLQAKSLWRTKIFLSRRECLLKNRRRGGVPALVIKLWHMCREIDQQNRIGTSDVASNPWVKHGLYNKYFRRLLSFPGGKWNKHRSWLLTYWLIPGRWQS